MIRQEYRRRVGSDRLFGAVVLALVAAACGISSSGEPSTSPVTGTLATSTTTLPASTTSPPVVTTTAPPSGITVDANLPDALSGDDIGWGDVDADWYLVLYDASRADPSSADDVRYGPVVLYVVDPGGTRYEVASWPSTPSYEALGDAVGSRAVVVGPGETLDASEWRLVDLTTGSMTVVYSETPPAMSPFGVDRARVVSLARPDGAGLIVYHSDSTKEWLELRSIDGTTSSVLFQQPESGTEDSLSWLQSPDGDSLVVGHDGGMALVARDGSTVRDLGAPDDHHCRPVRWWDADTVVAACYGTESSAPLTEYGNPHLYYGQVWLIDMNGSAGSPLTSIPDDPLFVGDFGYSDALQIGDTTLLQWTGDCGAGAMAPLQADGSAGPLEPVETPGMWVAGYRMINAIDTSVTVYGWDACDAYVGGLFVVGTDGTYQRDLTPRVGDGRGVIGVLPLG